MKNALAAFLGAVTAALFWVPVSYLIALFFYIIDSSGGAAHEVVDRLRLVPYYGWQAMAPGDWFSLATLAIFIAVGALVGYRYSLNVSRGPQETGAAPPVTA